MPGFAMVPRFPTPDYYLGRLRFLSNKLCLKIPEETLEELNSPPVFPSIGGMVLPAFFPSFHSYLGDDSGEVFDRLWEVIKRIFDIHWRHETIETGPDKFRLLPGIPFTEKKGLVWTLMDVGCYRDKSSDDIIGDETIPRHLIPHVHIMELAILVPEWVRNMDGKETPFAKMPGIQLNTTDPNLWACVPSLSWRKGAVGVSLRDYYSSARNNCHTVPILREY